MARVVNGGTVTTAKTSVFASPTDGNPISAFRVLALSGIVKVWATPLLPLSQSGALLSGVVLSSANTENNAWAPVSDIAGPFTSVTLQGIGASCLYHFRPEMGTR